MSTLNTRISFKNDTSINWSGNNPILLKGEIGIESDTLRYKIGDGTRKWNDITTLTPIITSDTNTNIVDGAVWYDTSISYLKIYKNGEWANIAYATDIPEVASAVENSINITVNGQKFTFDGSNEVGIDINKSTIGLGNVDNTSDLDKPISTLVQKELTNLDDNKVDKEEGKGLSSNDYTDDDKDLVSTAVQPEGLALALSGKVNTYIYETTATFELAKNNWNDEIANPDYYNIILSSGDNALIIDVDVPDWWYDATNDEWHILETQKVDLDGYATEEYVKSYTYSKSDIEETVSESISDISSTTLTDSDNIVRYDDVLILAGGDSNS